MFKSEYYYKFIKIVILLILLIKIYIMINYYKYFERK